MDTPYSGRTGTSGRGPRRRVSALAKPGFVGTAKAEHESRTGASVGRVQDDHPRSFPKGLGSQTHACASRVLDPWLARDEGLDR